MQPFKRTLVTHAGLDGFCAVATEIEVMMVTILDALLDRCDRRPDYPFIDTKLSILTGEDFPDPADASTDYKGPTAIYSWIQGRGLESLVGHARWLPWCSVLSTSQKQSRQQRLRRMIDEVFTRMETIRAKNGGRLFFTMTPEGDPFDLDETGRRRVIPIPPGRNFSDVFYAKGMLAAAHYLRRPDKIAEAKEVFRAVLADVRAERFVSDQVSFNPKNPSPRREGRFSHGPRMIALGACALFAELTDEDEWFDAGAAFLRQLMEMHLNLGQFDGLQRYDYFELRDAEGRPFMEDGHILSDPGHSLEFVGLGVKLLLRLRRHRETSSAHEDLLDECAKVMPEVFLHNFQNGFNPEIGGICKNFDLVSRRPISAEMPWWNIPETMRAAVEVLLLIPETQRRDEIVKALGDCWNGFATRFINPDVHLMAYQTIDVDGKPIDAIPATPDADPGYHTGLSLIDMLDGLHQLTDA